MKQTTQIFSEGESLTLNLDTPVLQKFLLLSVFRKESFRRTGPLYLKDFIQ